jgi:hypothetical protein
MDTTAATWQKGNINKLYFRYSINPRGTLWFSYFNLGWDTVQKDWGSVGTYNMLFSDLRFWLRNPNKSFALRLYAAKLFQPQNALLQDFIFLSAANPREQFKRFYLRSQGGLPDGLNYHSPGGGNIRGYLDHLHYGNEIFSSNVELNLHFDKLHLKRGTHPWSVRPTVTLFSDIAWLNSPENETDFFADAGIGVRFEQTLPDHWFTLFTGGRTLTIRFDFPIWVNTPVVGERALKFRWLFGFEQVI